MLKQRAGGAGADRHCEQDYEEQGREVLVFFRLSELILHLYFVTGIISGDQDKRAGFLFFVLLCSS